LKQNKRIFGALDGIRGVAALCVVVRHTTGFWGRFSMPYNDLAVDLFFLLSGVVIANAYEARLARGLGLGDFVKIRMQRFYPLYGLGTVIGVAAALALPSIGHGNWNWSFLALTTIFGALMLPTFNLMHPAYLFPLNRPGWSLFFEMAVNIVFALTWRRLSVRTLAVIVALSAAAMAATTLHYGELGTGWSWRHIAGGVPRVGFSFFAGVLLFRFLKDHARPIPISPWLLLAALPLIFLAPASWGRPYQLFCVLALFPAMVWVALHAEPGPRAAPIFAFLGRISYPIYAIHGPLYILAFRILYRAHALPRPSLLTGAAFLAILVALAAALDRWFDVPVRQWMARPRTKAPILADAVSRRPVFLGRRRVAEQRLNVGRRQQAATAGLKVRRQLQPADPVTVQADHMVADGGEHAPHLVVAALGDGQKG
jgi:peptidoglycan/LPS O-acetylase OafA/YrhL